MTAQQEAVNMIYNLPEDSARAVVEFIRQMQLENHVEEVEDSKGGVILGVAEGKFTIPEPDFDPSVRLGIGKGVINVPEGFDDWDEEIADLFEGNIV